MSLNQGLVQGLAKSSAIRKMFEEGARRAQLYGADKVFDFSIGNPIFDPPPEVHAALVKLAQEDLPGSHRYMPNAGFPEVRAYLAGQLAQETGLPFLGNDLIMTCGAGGGLNVALKTLLNPGDEVLVLAPYFVEYDAYIQNHGGIPVRVETTADFRPDVAAIRQAITPKTKAIIINSPNNPTGAVYTAQELADLGGLLEEASHTQGSLITLISDEPYKRIAYVDAVASPFAAYAHSLVVTSYSKDLALPGERIGYLAVSPRHGERGLLMQCAAVALRTLGFVNAPALWQRLLPLVGQAQVDLAPYRANRDLLVSGLAGFGYQVVEPGGAFYLFVKCPCEEARFIAAAQEKNLLLVPGSAFARAGYFRLAYCFAPQRLEQALPIFGQLMRELA